MPVLNPHQGRLSTSVHGQSNSKHGGSQVISAGIMPHRENVIVMMKYCPDSDWFLYKDIQRRPLQQSVWIPLRAMEDIQKEKHFGEAGYIRDTFACGSLAVPLEHRALGEKLGWSDIGIGHETRSHADAEGYRPADQYWLNWSDSAASGVEMVMAQHFGWDNKVWHLHQDIVLALELLREGDVWVRPEEGYIDVVRLHRNFEKLPTRIEIRTEHLRDYLAARGMALRIAWYRDRDAVLRDAEHIHWRNNPPAKDEPNYRFQTHFHDLHEDSGLPFGGQSAVFTARRTDVFPEVDVPEFGPETNDNVESESRTFGHEGARVFRAEGEIWCEEWIEPASHSRRVRGDKIPSTTSFIVDASGEVETADQLNKEDIGKYLWFKPDIITNLLSRRGGACKWHTRDTGSIELTFGYNTHFGVNDLGLITVYAYDVAKLPEWQRRIWQGFNVNPEGGVSSELLQAQMQVNPARTLAPEAYIGQALEDLDRQFCRCFGVPLFRPHSSRLQILASIHRFRANDQTGFYSLAKDISRLIVEAIDTTTLQKIAPVPKGGGTGSIKALERVLATVMSPTDARSSLSYLVGIYELRGADAHLPSSELENAYKLAGIDKAAYPLKQGLQLLQRTMQTIVQLYKVIEALPSVTLET